MIIPIGHEETQVRRLPWVSFGLILACFAALIATHAKDPVSAYEHWGLVPAEPTPLTAVSHMFMHGGWGHLLGNMFMLFLVGPPIEDRWGRPLFAGFYLLGGLASAGFYVLMTSGSPIPVVGASGAVAAVMGACLVRFLRSRIRFLYLFFIGFRLIKGTFWAPAWVMLPLWFASELLMASFTEAAGVSDGIAYWAHVGGFGFGALFALGMRKWEIEERFVHGAIESRITLAHNPVIEEAMGVYECGEAERAYDLLARAVGESRDNPDVVDAFLEVARGCGRSAQAASAVLPLVRDHLKRGESELAVRYWCQIADQALDGANDPALLVRLTPLLLAQQQPKQAILALRRAVDAGPSGLTPGMALRVMDLAQEIDPGTAARAARRALEAEGFDDAKRARIEAQASELEAKAASAPPLEVDFAAPDHSIPLDDPRADALGTEAPAGLAPQPEADPAAAAPAPTSQRSLELGADGALVRGEGGEELAPLGLAPEDLPLPQISEAPPLESPPPVPLLQVRGQPRPQAILPPLSNAQPPQAPPPLPEARPLQAPPLPPQPPLPQPPPLPAARPLEPDQAPLSPEDQVALATAAALPRFSGLKAIEAVPVELCQDALVMTHAGGKRGRLAYAKVDALAVAAVGGLAAMPVLIIDLILNWSDTGEEALRLIRIRSDSFNARQLVPEAGKPLEAFRTLVEQLLSRTGAVALPDREGVLGRPYRTYSDLASYQREVLEVAG